MEKFTLKLGFLFILVQLIGGYDFRNNLGHGDCQGRAFDVAFVLDATSAVSALHFRKQVNIIRHVVNNMDVGLRGDQVRVGVISLGDRTRINLHFSKSGDQLLVKSKIARLRQLGGDRDLADGLMRMCGSMFRRRRGSRQGVKHIAVILTDEIAQDETESWIAAQACQRSGVELFAIGTGSDKRENGLWKIVSQPVETHFLHFQTFDNFHGIQKHVIQQLCRAVLESPSNIIKNGRGLRSEEKKTSNDERVCHNKVADVFFLLDSSSSIRKHDFKKEINVVESIIRRFDISATLTRVGISTFSHEYLNLLTFGDSNDKSEVLRRLSTIKYLSGGTRTGHALHRLRTKVFNGRSTRPEADRIIVVFTDGRSRDYRRTTLEAKMLKKSGVKIFVVGIGSYVDQEELRDIASVPTEEFLHTFDSFDTLSSKSGLLGAKTCEGLNHLFINDQDVCNSSQATDVMFMLSHNRLGERKTKSAMKVVAEVVEMFGTDGPFRVGTMFDECLVNHDIPIGSIMNKTKLLRKIDDFQYGTPKSMIQQLRFDVFYHRKRTYRRRARQIGLLFLDKEIKLDDPSIQIESRRAHARGIQLYAIVVGKGINLEQVERLIAPRDRIIVVPSYESLEQTLPLILVNRLCFSRSNYLTYNHLSH